MSRVPIKSYISADGSGNEQIFTFYYHKYKDRLIGFSTQYVKDRCLAEDIVQEVFKSFWLKIGELDHSRSMESYLFRSTKNRIINTLQKNSQRIFEHALPLQKVDAIENENSLDKETHQVIKQVVDNLPERRRLVFQMKVFKELSNREVSERLNITIPTVKSQFTKACSYIRGAIKPYL